MPSTDTISAFNVFVPLTVIASARMNENFANYRGHALPIDPNTATGANATYDLGSTTYRWRNAFLSDGIGILATTTSATPSTGLKVYNKSGTIVARNSSGVDLPLGPGAAWSKYTLSHGSFAIAGLTQTGTLFSAEPKEMILGYFCKHSADFTANSASITALTIKLGLSGTIDKYIPGFNIKQSVTTTAYYTSSDFDLPSFNATTAVQWTVEAVGGNLNALSAGALDIWVLKSILP